MAYRNSISVPAALALLTGCLGIACPAAKAGEIIEFSAPTALLDVPQQEHEIKQESTSSIRGNFQGPDAVSPTFMPSAPIIIPAQSSRNGFGWHSPFQDDENGNDGSSLDLFAPATGPAHTNRWASSLQKNPDGEGLTEFGSRDALFERDSQEGEGLLHKDRFGNRADDRDAWSFDAHGPTAEQRMREGDFIPENEKFKSGFDQSSGGLPPPNSFSQPDPYRASAFSSGASGSLSSDDSLRNQGVQPFSQSSAMRAWDTPTTTRPQRTRAQEQAQSDAKRTQPPAAVLVWPRMPGGLNPN